ncbi:radical SAM protein [Candidatus Omnitrophota bacterium]
MFECTSCPRKCKIDRSKDRGLCGANDTIEIASHCLHRGEEPVISGVKGSGTIFFSHCNLKCVYCQNYDISQEGLGKATSPEELITIMLSLQNDGAHNINFVSPSHYAYLLPDIIKKAKKQGLDIPVVYNTNAFDNVISLKNLEGLIDIYMPDIKYSENKNAALYSKCDNYVEYSRHAIAEMFRQVGPLELNDEEIATHGLLVRHLVLPHDVAGSYASLDFLASLSNQIYVSIMAQYHPCHNSINYNNLHRTIKSKEYKCVVDYAVELGFERIFTQEMTSHDTYLPNFNEDHPFE